MKKYKLIFGLVFLFSFALVFATDDCVWRTTSTTNGGHYNVLFEDAGTIYLGTHQEILSSDDWGESFSSYSKPVLSKSDYGKAVNYINKVSGRLVAGSYDGLYKVIDEDSWDKFLSPDPMQTFQKVAVVGNTFYGTDGFGKIVFKDGMSTTSTDGTLAAEIPDATKYTDIASDGTNLWVGTIPNKKLYYSPNPGANWFESDYISAHVVSIDNVQFVGGLALLSVFQDNSESFIFFSNGGETDWQLYSAQISDGQVIYEDLLMFTHDSLALVKMMDGSEHVYLQTGTTTWEEYGKDLDDVITSGKDLLKMSNGELLVIGNAPADKQVVVRCKENQAPVVSVGEDFTVTAGELVILEGAVTDPEGDEITDYDWKQLPAKVQVNLAGFDDITATFNAKIVGTYVFQFSATDKYLDESEPVEVKVTVVATDIGEQEDEEDGDEGDDSSSSSSSSSSSGGGVTSSECTKDSDCKTGKVCENKKCVETAVEDGVETGKEDSLDTEEEDEETTYCSHDFDCADDEHCRNKVCAKLDCEDIVEHQCVTPITPKEGISPGLKGGIVALVVLGAAAGAYALLRKKPVPTKPASKKITKKKVSMKKTAKKKYAKKKRK
jgi:hypothetical protein